MSALRKITTPHGFAVSFFETLPDENQTPDDVAKLVTAVETTLSIALGRWSAKLIEMADDATLGELLERKMAQFLQRYRDMAPGPDAHNQAVKAWEKIKYLVEDR